MAVDRLEVRLDPEHRRRLAEVAAAEGKPVSDVVRQMIDRAYALLANSLNLQSRMCPIRTC